MSDYSKFMTWQLDCRDRGGYGASSGDTFYSGLRNYDQLYPCPNGLGLSTVTHENCKPWREKVEKAKAFLAECRREDRLNEIRKLELFGSDDVADLTAIAKGELTVEHSSFKNGCSDSLSGPRPARA